MTSLGVRLASLGVRLASRGVRLASLRVRLTSLRVLPASLTVLASLLTVPAAEAQGRISNAKIETRTLSGPLQREVEAVAARGGVVWVGYRAPMIPGRRQMCCYDSIARANDCCGMCRLESGGGITMTQSSTPDGRETRVVLEPPADVIILMRLEAKAVTRIRTFTPDCDIDGGEMPIVWLEKVPPAESIAWLTSVARAAPLDSALGRPDGRERDSRVLQPAIAAIALHADQSALKTLVTLAREDQRPGARNQALFWLSQRAGEEAVATIANAIQNDPETAVKRRAVFALSQLPKDEGIPLLIQVARTNRNVEVRRQAMFWLGQSKDARAVQFFEEILLKRP